MLNRPRKTKRRNKSKKHWRPDLCFTKMLFKSFDCCWRERLLLSARPRTFLRSAPCLSIPCSIFSALFLTMSSALTISPAISSSSLSFSSNSLRMAFSCSLRSLSSSSSSSPSPISLSSPTLLILNISIKSLLTFL